MTVKTTRRWALMNPSDPRPAVGHLRPQRRVITRPVEAGQGRVGNARPSGDAGTKVVEGAPDDDPELH
jgi:hypothetical protein